MKNRTHSNFRINPAALSPSPYRPCPDNATTLSVETIGSNTSISCKYPNSNSVSLTDTVNCWLDKPKLVSNVIYDNVLHGVCGS